MPSNAPSSRLMCRRPAASTVLPSFIDGVEPRLLLGDEVVDFFLPRLTDRPRRDRRASRLHICNILSPSPWVAWVAIIVGARLVSLARLPPTAWCRWQGEATPEVCLKATPRNWRLPFFRIERTRAACKRGNPFIACAASLFHRPSSSDARVQDLGLCRLQIFCLHCLASLQPHELRAESPHQYHHAN